MINKFSPLNDQNQDKDTVISFLSQKSLFKAGDLMLAVRQCFYSYGLQELFKQLASRGGIPQSNKYKQVDWKDKGVECEILRPGMNWKKGKIRINVTVEFCPEEAESPLDDIRQDINNNS